ncbi:restriction endonuclease [bacterium]|nr:MAG: restriction endonuclease [bacterium]
MPMEAYQFRPDVFTAVVEAIALIRNSKRDVVTFFRGAGLEHPRLAEYERQIRTDRASLRKIEMAHTLLKVVNEMSGNHGLKVRREVLKGIVDFNNFDSIYQDKRLAAKGAVAKARELIDEKDAFTRMQQERDAERSQRLARQNAELEREKQRASKREDIKSRLYKLFTMQDEYERGKTFEVLLNDWCNFEEILVRESFRITGNRNNRTVEQVDGVIEVKGQIYVVEAKWWKNLLGPKDVAQHVMGVLTRGDGRGLFIANPGFTEAAIVEVGLALTHRIIVLGTTEELYKVMATNHTLTQWIVDKANAAVGERNPFKPYRGISEPD